MHTETRRGIQHGRVTAGLQELIQRLRERDERRLPTERELSEKFSVGRNTVRAAVGDLVDQGVLERIPGKGTFIVGSYKTLLFANWVNSEMPESAYLDKVVTAFERRQQSARIVTLNHPYDMYGDRVLKLLAGEEPPDVVQVNPFMLHAFQRLDLLAPLTQALPQHILKRQYAAAMEEMQVDHEVYALPWALCPLVLYYNKTVLERCGMDPDSPPETLDELFEMVERVGQDGPPGVSGICLPLDMHAISFMQVYPFILAFGGSFADSVGDLRIDAHEATEALRWLQRLYATGGLPRERSIHGSRMAFAMNRVAFVVDGPYGLGNFRQLSGKGRGFDQGCGVATIPVGRTGRSASVLLSHALAVSRKSRAPEFAYQWIEELAGNKEHAQRYFNEFGMIPAFRDLLHSSEYADDRFASVLIRQMETAEPGPLNHPLFLRALPFVLQTMARVIIDGDDPQRRLAFLREVLRMTSQERHLVTY